MIINWKGKKSNEYSGLIICELPPITKPKMRVEETVVKGVDGSFIEELGYESYDKIVKIGLTTNYNINSIIDYFTGEGKLILDNENDKYYNAKIIESIDYNRLLRFKTADIKFRVQPFKYSNTETDKIFNITDETSIEIQNSGNYESKPIIKITGSGTIEFKQNGITLFTYGFPENDTFVVLDCNMQDAYVNNDLKNRNMNGSFPILNPGKNTFSWTGNITKIEISNYSRWL